MAVPVGWPLQWAAANSLDIAFDTEMTAQLQAEVHHAAQEMFVGSGNWRVNQMPSVMTRLAFGQVIDREPNGPLSLPLY
ncbi:hypothetical protein [Pseudomonas sp. ZB1P45]|uniref:hypothetical protein n=1 Tax=Pseudomonas frigoris TaxID=3398356 RepID=UPI00106A7DDD|nr:hypothetical protein CUN63_01355 [Pseudomonas sp. ACM7]